jgi:hypothetical protein
MNIQTKLTKFRAIFKEKIAKIGKNTEGGVDEHQTDLTIFRAIFKEKQLKMAKILRGDNTTKL